MAIAVQQFTRNIGGRDMVLEVGRLAGQANGAVTVRYGDTMVLVTACTSKRPREGIDFLPLTVEFEQRLYAAGRIPGSFFRREGRPPEEAILSARLTDRPVRPLFPKNFHHEVQVVITVFSADQENDPDILGIIGASAALSMSEMPFEGPIGATRVGYINGEFVINPTFPQLADSSLDLVVVSTEDKVMMIEAGAKEVSEQLAKEGIRRGHEVNQEIVRLQKELVAAVGKPTMSYESKTQPTKEMVDEVTNLVGSRLDEAIFINQEKAEQNEAVAALLEEVRAHFGEGHEPAAVSNAFDEFTKKRIAKKVIAEDVRPDGRNKRQIRPISIELDLIPRVHGSGMFKRGQTQVVTIATLGSLSMKQRLDSINPEETKRYIHHYNFPPFSVGEVGRMFTGRREIGHGALAERALAPVIPDEEEFPYTIRMVSEVVSSNGSTSMASTCASTLSLMAAGVPIKAPVTGIAMGLVVDEEGNHGVLTDIQGIEDHLGEMDFKVAGTPEGITAMQMDIKLKGISLQIVDETLDQALEARLFILDKVKEAIPAPRTELSAHAPRMYRIKIPVDKIGALIGPGGKTIRGLSESTGTSIDVANDGTVTIGAINEDGAQRALESIQGMTRDLEIGQIYTGKVQRIMSFGAFVEVLPGKEGLVRLSEIADFHIPSVEEAMEVGDEVMVKVIEVDAMGRVNLSRKALVRSDVVVQDDLSERLGQLFGRLSERGEQDGPPEGDRPSFDDRRGPPRRPGGYERRD
ncbi:MAG: polyribonucleotide nucleotidyltransferase [Chloroflexi bacterium]|jgi:polyribonucleotide nucleotidyltransferase|nr:MAG: polyribonucleotide nucleotidyltransferase [Chloroflexota bacterium]